MSIKTALRAAVAAALLAAGLATPAAANVQVGSSGWQWGNPLPQGNTLRALTFVHQTGYAAGDFGTLLKTTDGGSSWSGLPAGTLAGLTTVQALDSDTVFAGGGCVARRTTDGGRTFTAVRFSAVESGCRVGLRDLSFVTRDVGWLLMADGGVVATTDGGTSFARRTAVPETQAAGGFQTAGAIAFTSDRKGFAASGGKLYRTLDGGSSWSVVAEGGAPINRIVFDDAEHGFAVGSASRLLRTDDGGASWQPKGVPGPPQELTSIACSPRNVCLIATAGGTQLLRVKERGDGAGGVIAPAGDPIYAADFASHARVVAVGANGATVRSDDEGETFASLGARLGGRYAALRAGGEPGSAFAPGEGGALARTTDGGRTWATGDVPTTADLLDAAFPAASVGYALDGDGGLFRTDNGGGSWQTLGTGSVRRPRAVLAPDVQHVLVVGPRGIRRSTDAGETFAPVGARLVRGAQLTGATATRGGVLFAWGPRIVVRSVDRGRSWSALPAPVRRGGPQIMQVSFTSATAGLLRDGAGRVWRTTTGGRAWTRLTAVGTEAIRGMAAVSARTAYLVGERFGGREGGYLLRTADGGATWQPQFVVDAPIRPDGIAVAGGVDYLLAGDASLLSSRTGGVVGTPSALTIATRARRPTSARRITVTGRLEPAASGAQVTVSALRPGATGWRRQTVAVASNGTFATAWTLTRGTTTFVAQWAGDFASAGAGSRPLTVTVAPSRARRR
jgi:photosystem II stability/assembly factor-like uncharacterized protein